MSFDHMVSWRGVSTEHRTRALFCIVGVYHLTHARNGSHKFTRRMDPPLHGFLESDFLAFFPSHCPYTLHMYSSLCSGYLSVGSSVQPFGQSP